jgi:transposase
MITQLLSEPLPGWNSRSARRLRSAGANRRASTWAFAELQELLAYKAVPAGSLGIKVDADRRHQACPRCGYTSRAYRPKPGLLFVYQQCHYTLHAGLVGARNIVALSAGYPARLDGYRKARHLSPRDQTAKQKRHGGIGRPSCGGVRPQAPRCSAGVL